MTPLTKTPSPINSRSDILDILRSIALLGICITNYPVISLYIFQSPDVLQSMPSAQVDKWLGYFHFAFIDGKFYPLFSLLFGIGLYITISGMDAAGGKHAHARDDSFNFIS